MKTQIRILLGGALVIVPLAITVYVLWSVGSWMDDKGRAAVDYFWGEGTAKEHLRRGAGALLLLAVLYLAGLLTRVWGFRPLWERFERLLARVPGVKIIYESVRDLMKLFGGGAGSMGRTVEYRPPGTDLAVLGILTNEDPAASRGGGQKRVAVYLPMAYMFGGPTVLVSPQHLRELDIPVEQALKLAATAHVGGRSPATPAAKAEEKTA
jgi:uncharacterized membrane protein